MSKTRDELLAEIEAFLLRHDMYASIFGRNATNDTALVSRLRAGRDIHLATADKIRAYMRRIDDREGRRSSKGRPKQAAQAA